MKIRVLTRSCIEKVSIFKKGTYVCLEKRVHMFCWKRITLQVLMSTVTEKIFPLKFLYALFLPSLSYYKASSVMVFRHYCYAIIKLIGMFFLVKIVGEVFVI